ESNRRCIRTAAPNGQGRMVQSMSQLTTIGDCRVAAPRIMGSLVDPATNTVRFRTLQALDAAFRGLGFTVAENQAYGPPGGRQIFYQNGLMVARIKSKGDERGFRANQPHMSVALTDPEATYRGGQVVREAGAQFRDWFNDLAKINARGGIEPKSLTTADRFQP